MCFSRLVTIEKYVHVQSKKSLEKVMYLKKNSSNHIFAFLANFFECWRLDLIGCSADSTNQKSPKFKKVCKKGKNSFVVQSFTDLANKSLFFCGTNFLIYAIWTKFYLNFFTTLFWKVLLLNQDLWIAINLQDSAENENTMLLCNNIETFLIYVSEILIF